MDDPFRFEFRPGAIRYGTGCVRSLGEEVAALDADRVLVVSGRTVGTTDAVVDPVRAGLGERLVDVLAVTTPEKRVSAAAAVAERACETEADALVAVGGGSSLDVTTVAAALLSTGTDDEAAVRAVLETGGVAVGESVPPIVAVPTTLAGAGLTQVAGIGADPASVGDDGAVAHGGVSDPALMPSALFYDPELFRTTPEGVLLPSAMNGFDKAVEAVYARTATPVTDATALRALRLLRAGLPALGRGDRSDATLRRAVVGTVLAQYGVSRPDAGTLSVLHAYGHALSRPYEFQQGAAHGLVAPAALSHLLGEVDARRRTLAEGLRAGAALAEREDGDVDEGRDPDAVPARDVDDGRDPATVVVEEVRAVRDGLGLDRRLRGVPGVERDHLPEVARATVEDGVMGNAPAGYEPTPAAVERVLESVW
ncbi:alcohol dehydrogenase [Halobacteriales archaeon SW_5_70_135]|nr:MAG: alcohol dehydrogenase [Halobacteriales archaeon SW_5_70_135]